MIPENHYLRILPGSLNSDLRITLDFLARWLTGQFVNIVGRRHISSVAFNTAASRRDADLHERSHKTTVWRRTWVWDNISVRRNQIKQDASVSVVSRTHWGLLGTVQPDHSFLSFLTAVPAAARRPQGTWPALMQCNMSVMCIECINLRFQAPHHSTQICFLGYFESFLHMFPLHVGTFCSNKEHQLDSPSFQEEAASGHLCSPDVWSLNCMLWQSVCTQVFSCDIIEIKEGEHD